MKTSLPKIDADLQFWPLPSSFWPWLKATVGCGGNDDDYDDDDEDDGDDYNDDDGDDDDDDEEQVPVPKILHRTQETQKILLTAAH